jgi:Holliday junction resolvasome RuvABC endonuclease subunit
VTRDLAHIGIDPSYSAYAVIVHVAHTGATDVHELLFDFSPARAGREGARLMHIRSTLTARLDAIRKAFDVRAVVTEGYAPSSKFNREVMGELGGITKLVLAELFDEWQLYTASPSALKKFVTGSGNAPKDNVLLQVFKPSSAPTTSPTPTASCRSAAPSPTAPSTSTNRKW